MEPQRPAAARPDGSDGASRWPDDGYPAPEGRPGHVTAAAIALIVLGVIVGLVAVLLLVIGLTFETLVSEPVFNDQLGDVSPEAGGVFVVMGFLFLGHGVLQVVSGIFILPGRAWARITGLVAGVLGTLLALIGVLPGQAGGVNIFFMLILIAYVYAVWVLISSGGWFRR